MANFSRKGPSSIQKYHTSLDNKNLIDFSAIIDTIKIFLNIFNLIENNYTFKNKIKLCEPFFSKYINFYGKI